VKNKRKRNYLFAEYNPKSALHNFLFLLASIALVISLFAARQELCEKTNSYIAYEKDDLAWKSPYGRQFDAFTKGQLYLDIEPGEDLLALENPYDRDARDAAGVYYLWDHALYGGKYYSYFGAAPLITVYLPIYLVTGGLPNDAYATMLLAVYAVIFLLLAFREAVLRFVPKANLWLFLLGLFAFTAVSGVYTAVIIADFYYIPVVSALGCSMAFIFYFFRAMRKSKLCERRTLLALSAVSLGLTVLSRPTAALMCLAAFPLFAEFLFKSKQKDRKKTFCTVSCFALPLIVFAAAVMWYNAARFSSPFDFGERYQLTVSDVSKNTLEPKFAFSVLFSYFLFPFWSKPVYPFITMQGNIVLPDGARYVYGDIYVGAFALVLPAAAMLCARAARKRAEAGERDFVYNAFCICSGLTSVAVAFADFCRGGVNMRYIYDIVPILALTGAVALLLICKYAKGAKRVAAFFFCAFAFLGAIYANVGVMEAFLARM